MNLLEINDFSYFFKYIFADWAIALFIFFAVLILLAVLFKGLKVGIVLILIAAVISGLGVLAAFVFMITTRDLLGIIDFAVKWAPTVLFVTIVTISTLVNAKRGLRKSLILLAQAVGAGVVCIVFYYVFATSEWADKTILTVVNQVLGGNSLQNLLGVSEDCRTIREIFIQWLPGLFSGDIKILISENSQYLATLADMGFRIVFAVISLVLYFVLVFLLYVIYFFAYPERRYKRKIKRAVTENKAYRTYTKHHIGGGAVGLVRGITTGLLSLSFIGSALFMVAGGTGQGTLGDYDFENDNYNFYYSIYRSVESYGAQGIFKVLNTMTDASDTPFYLFAADMVLSGTLDDEENDIDDEFIKFREEIAAYTGFAKDALNLLMKYGEQDIVPILNGNGGSKAFDTIVNIMTIPEFRTEFDVLIQEFDSQTYVINLGMSLIYTVVEHIDEMSITSDLDEGNRELLKVLFKKGHFSETIPDERLIKENIEAGIISADDVEARPRLKISHILTKDDIRIALGVALSVLAGEQNPKDTLGFIKSLLPQIKQLSILQTSRSAELDPVFSRLYCYFGNKYLTAEDEEGIPYTEIADRNIKWLSELNTLVDVTGDALTLWGNIYDSNKEMLEVALTAFDENDPNYAENSRCFKNIRSALERSAIIGTVMSTSFMNSMITGVLSLISENIYIPADIVYNSKVDADGNVVETGEMYKLFGGFMLLSSSQNRGFLDEVLSIAKGGEVKTGAILSSLSEILASEDDDGNTLSYYLTQSALLRSMISIVMIDRGADFIYVPDVALEQLENGDRVNLITMGELASLFDSLPAMIEYIGPILESGDIQGHTSEIAELIKSDVVNSLLEKSRIFEGTAANLMIEVLRDKDAVVVPASLLESVDGWVSANGKKGELRKLLTALNAMELDFEEITQGNIDVNTMLDKIVGSEDELLGSQILHYTFSKYLLDGAETGGFKLLVPNGARVPNAPGDTLEFVVKKSEIISLVEVVSEFDLSDDEVNTSSVLYKLVLNKEKLNNSLIMSASIVYTLTNNDDFNSALTIPHKFVTAGSEQSLLDYNKSNAWKSELPRLIDALDEILEISQKGEDFEFNPDGIQDDLSSLLNNLNEQSRVNGNLTKLDVCYLSEIVRSEITVRLDETLVDGNIVSEEVAESAKYHGYYRETELQSLANALNIFEIDLLNTDSEGMTDKVVAKALTLNDPLEEYGGQTGLQVIYPSKILSSIFSSELDKALEGSIDENIVARIKNGRNYYPEQDVADFIDAAREMDITDFENAGDIEFSAVDNLTGASHLHPESGKTRLDVIYTSRLAAGIITKSLYDALNSGDLSEKYIIDHSKAYMDGIKLYKQVEVESIYEIFYNSGDNQGEDSEAPEAPDGGETEGESSGDYDLSKVDLLKVSNYLYDETQENKTRSYLLASAISAIIRDNENLIIPVNVVDEEGCVNPQESSLIILVFNDISEDRDLEEMDEWKITKIPDDNLEEGKMTRTNMIKSEVMRACISYNMGVQSHDAGKTVYISEDCVKVTTDTNGYSILIISEEELRFLAAALDIIYGDSEDEELTVPTFTMDDILRFNEIGELDTLLASDIMKYKICECILDLGEKNANIERYLEGKTIEQKAYNLYSELEEDVEVISENTIRTFIANYDLIKGGA